MFENPLLFCMACHEAAYWAGLWWIESALAAAGFWREWTSNYW